MIVIKTIVITLNILLTALFLWFYAKSKDKASRVGFFSMILLEIANMTLIYI